MISLFAALFGLAAAHASGCVQKNASHCANLDGDATCAARGGGSCSKCTSVNDGCVGTVEPECAVGGGGSETTAVGTGTTTEPDTTIGTVSMTSVGPSMTSMDDTSSSDEEEGPKMDIPPPCGNGMLDEGETCDGELMTVPDCVALGYASGELGCTEECEFDLAGCNGDVPCGDGDIDRGEECDGLMFGDETCQSRRGEDFGGGLHCEPGTCTIDDTTCCKLGGVACLVNEECCSGTCQLLPLLTCKSNGS